MTSVYLLCWHLVWCTYVKPEKVNGSRGERGLYCRSEKVWLYKEVGSSSGAPSPCLQRGHSDEAEAYARSNKKEKDNACVSDDEAMILRSGETLGRIASELRGMTMDGLLGVMN